MFSIKARLGMKTYSNHVLQDEKDFNITLNSREGVLNFILEQNPFTFIQITQDGKDVTDSFINEVRFVKSRYEGAYRIPIPKRRIEDNGKLHTQDYE